MQIPYHGSTANPMIRYRVPEMPLKPLARISPSRFTSLQECQLREIWSAQKDEAPLLPEAPSLKIGLVIHKILEHAVQGMIRSEAEMSGLWELEISRIEEQMKNNPLEANLVPLFRHVRNYEVKKYSCFAAIKNYVCKKSCCKSKDKRHSVSELWVETADKKAGGRIDLVRQTQSGVQIIDFKSGRITDEVSGSIIKHEYQIQMKLYGAIYYAARKSWPVRLTLIGLNNVEMDVPFEAGECEQLLCTAKELLDNINQKLSHSSQENFAFPTPMNCRNCGFRPACRRYWSEKTDCYSWPLDVKGVPVFIQTSGNGFLRVDIDSGNGIARIRGLDPERFDFLTADCQEVCFCNLRMDPAPGFFIPTAFTQGYITKA